MNETFVLAVCKIILKILPRISAKRKTNVSHVTEQHEHGYCTREDEPGAAGGCSRSMVQVPCISPEQDPDNRIYQQSQTREGGESSPEQQETGWRQDSRQVNQIGPKSRQETGLEMYTYSIAQAHHKDTA